MPFTIQKRDKMTKDVSLATTEDLDAVKTELYVKYIYPSYGDNANLSSCSSWTSFGGICMYGVCLYHPESEEASFTKTYILNFSIDSDMHEDRWFRIDGLPGKIVSAQATAISNGNLIDTASGFVVSYSGATLYIGQDGSADRVKGVCVQVICVKE